MLYNTFRSNLLSSRRLFTSVRKIYTPYSVTSNAILSRCYATSKPIPSPKNVPRAPANAPHTARRASPRPSSLTINEVRQLRKIELADKLFNAGDKTLYRATSRLTRFRLTSWSLTLLCGSGIWYFWVNNLLNLDYYYAISHDHPNVVFAAFAATSIFLGLALGWSAKQSWNHVHGIDLIQKSGAVFLQVTVRRPVPFMRRSFVVRPQDIIVDDRVVAMMSIPAGLLPSAPSEASPSAFTLGVIRESLKSASRFFYNIFDAARVFFSQEGIVSIDVQTGEGDKKKVERYYMDAGGLYFHHDEKIALWEMVDAKDPYAGH